MITGNTALLIAGIGVSIILLYIFYLVLRLNCRLDTKLKKPCPYKEKNGAPANDCPVDKYPEPVSKPKSAPKPKPAPKPVVPEEEEKEKAHPLMTCSPEMYQDYAERLVKRLMKTAAKVTKDRGQDARYYNRLMIQVYRKFLKLNSTILNKSERMRSRKFLKEIKKEINDYEKKLQKGGSWGSAIVSVSEGDLARTLNENEQAIYQVYPSLE